MTSIDPVEDDFARSLDSDSLAHMLRGLSRNDRYSDDHQTVALLLEAADRLAPHPRPVAKPLPERLPITLDIALPVTVNRSALRWIDAADEGKVHVLALALNSHNGRSSLAVEVAKVVSEWFAGYDASLGAVASPDCHILWWQDQPEGDSIF